VIASFSETPGGWEGVVTLLGSLLAHNKPFMNAFKLWSPPTRGGARWGDVPWNWYETAEDVADQLRLWAETEWREHDKRRLVELAEKVLEFQRKYFSDGGVCLGYAVIHRRGDIIIKALVAHGENDVYLEAVDIEEWLGSQDP
jgi:hypothetical protein